MNPSLSGHILRKNAELELFVTDPTPGDGGPHTLFEYFVHGAPQRWYLTTEDLTGLGGGDPLWPCPRPVEIAARSRRT
jgi:hypothetical protein